MSDPFCRRCRQPLGGTHLPDCIWEDLVVLVACVLGELGILRELEEQRVVMFTVADRIEGSKHEEKP